MCECGCRRRGTDRFGIERGGGRLGGGVGIWENETRVMGPGVFSCGYGIYQRRWIARGCWVGEDKAGVGEDWEPTAGKKRVLLGEERMPVALSASIDTSE